MKTLLIMTVGQTDVQLVNNGLRHKLDANVCGELHDTIEGRLWSVVDTPKSRSRDSIKELPEGKLSLCTPKLDAVLAKLDQSRPLSALIFVTKRKGPRDPRYAGEVLERRLLDRGIDIVKLISFLEGDEHLEDPSNELDAVVKSSVVTKLSEGIRDATKNLLDGDRVFVATTGGLAAANELINELVRLHCVGRPIVTALEVPDGDFAKQDDRAVEEKFHPAAGYRSRWHALSLIEKGNLLGAWGAVSHLHNAPGQEWTNVVNWLALFASSLPLPSDCKLEVLSHKRMAVRAAIRVELALRAGDVPRAVHGTVAFFEAALWDHLLDRVERSTDPNRRRYFKIKNNNQEPQGDNLLRDIDGGDDNRKRPFEFKDEINGIRWYWIHDGDGGPAARLCIYFINSENLQNYNLAIGNKIRELRNDIAHNEPTPELMNDARYRMKNQGLWSNNNTFLSQNIVKDVLSELGTINPNSLCDNLIQEIREIFII